MPKNIFNKNAPNFLFFSAQNPDREAYSGRSWATHKTSVVYYVDAIGWTTGTLRVSTFRRSCLIYRTTVDGRTRRHSWKISNNRSKPDIFSERVINRWNKVDVHQTSLNGFKQVLERRRKVEKLEMDFSMN